MNRFKLIWLILKGECKVRFQNIEFEGEFPPLVLAINCKFIHKTDSTAEACKTAKAGDEVHLGGKTCDSNFSSYNSMVKIKPPKGDDRD